MKRFLALLLTLVMLVSVCGLQAFAADGDTPADTGDELVVYTRSGATRTFHVGDTFSYTYWFRLTTKGSSVNKITGHVLYDSQCLTVNADGCKFPNMTSPSTKNNAGDFEFHDTLAASHRHFGRRLPNHQLQTVAAACGYDLMNHHHALADAEACAAIAVKILFEDY